MLPNRARGVVPTIVFHGEEDRTVNPINGDQVIAQAKANIRLQRSVRHGQSSGGVAYQQTVYTDGRQQACP